MVGTVTHRLQGQRAVDEARRRIELILDPPTADMGAEYTGRVVNITKFGAFVNILPGRDGLLHISKIGRGKRIDKVEDVLELGQEIVVRVDDIDNQGKLSLSLAGDAPEGGEGGSDGGDGGGRERASAETAVAATGTGHPGEDRARRAQGRVVRGRRGTSRPRPSSVTSARAEAGGRSDRGGDRGGERSRGGRRGGGGRRR